MITDPSTSTHNWRVTRFCCTSGMCLDCRAVANGTKRKRVVHADKLTEAKARQMAANWSAHGAEAEPMPDVTR